MQIISNLLLTKTSYDIPNEFYDLIIKKLLDSNTLSDQHSWINCMKEIVNILFLKEPIQISANDFIMKFLRSLADQIHWPLENCDYQLKLNDISWRMIFVRLLASINALLTHRVQKYECTNLSSIKKIQKEQSQSIINDDDNDIDSENSLASSSISRQLLFDEEDEDKINNEENNHEDNHFMQQHHSHFSHLEQELLQSNSLFCSIDKWIETVRITCLCLLFSFSLIQKIFDYIIDSRGSTRNKLDLVLLFHAYISSMKEFNEGALFRRKSNIRQKPLYELHLR
jgi:hemerythrin-like domain-containing protein